MKIRHQGIVGLALLMLAAWVVLAFAQDTLTLKDGTVLRGSVMKNGSEYFIELPSGATRTVKEDDVKSFEKGAKAPTPTPVPATSRPAATQPGGGGMSTTNPATTRPALPRIPGPPKGLTFGQTRMKADQYLMPKPAARLWQTYINNNPTATDLEQAKSELTKWQKLIDQGAEKIDGKWIGGDQRKALVDKANALMSEGEKLFEADRSLMAIQKYEEAVKVYPNAYLALDFLGYMRYEMGKIDDAAQYYARCLALRPDSPAALNNAGVVQCRMNQWLAGVQKLHQSAQAKDDKYSALNLVKAVRSMPADLRYNPALKPAVEAANLLHMAYKMEKITDWNALPYLMIRPDPRRLDENGGSEPPPSSGMLGNGSGFIIQEDGLILTNRHVADPSFGHEPPPEDPTGAPPAEKTVVRLMVKLSDGSMVPAEVVKVSEKLDLALLKLQPKTPVKYPTISLSSAATPPEGATCYVLGFPLASRLGMALKVTQGIISGAATRAPNGVDILVDAKVNPGNSGGPLLDKFGQAIGVVSMKSAN
ncbi:MAG: trypsin-like peptidase domain-containing protein, partial [Phycisphaerae bacterium]